MLCPLQTLPFKVHRYGNTYCPATIPAVVAILHTPAWAAFQAQTPQRFEAMESARRNLLQLQLAPALAGQLTQLQHSMQSLTTAVQEQGKQEAGGSHGMQVPASASAERAADDDDGNVCQVAKKQRTGLRGCAATVL
jgi:hypothetical protein